MKVPVILTSPLAGTAAAGVLLALLAIPLLRLTSAPHTEVPINAAVVPTPDNTMTPAVLRIKLLAPAQTLRVGTPGAPLLLDLKDLPAGESEHDVMMPVVDGTCELEFAAAFAGNTPETAVFLTAMPDGMEDKTLFVTGLGELRDILRFNWPQNHH